MQTHEFQDLGEFEEVKHRLARASRHPVHVDLGTEYDETAESPEPADPRPIDRYHVIWNNRDDSFAYQGSKRYNLIQHREVLDTIETAVENTTGEIDKGVIHDYGASIDGVLVFGNQEGARVDVGDIVGEDYVPPEGADWTRDRLGLGMRFYNGWDGRTKVGGSTMGYRYICQNWMVWGEHTIAEDEDFHLKGKEEGIGLDPEFFEDMIHEVFEEKQRVMDIVQESNEELIPLNHVPDLLEAAGFGKQYARSIAAEVRDQTHPADGKTTRWHVYNAATAYIDHEKAPDIGESVYQRHHDDAWDVLSADYEEPEQPRSLRAFAATA